MIFEKIQEDIKLAMKEKKTEELLALRTLVSDIKNVAIKNGRKEPEEADSIQALTKAIKQREDSVEQFKNGGREELAAIELAQAACFKKYLPVQMNEEEVRETVLETVRTLNISSKKEMGSAMKNLAHLKGKADMKLVNKILSEILI